MRRLKIVAIAFLSLSFFLTDVSVEVSADGIDPVRLAAFEQYAMTHAGNRDNGKAIFNDPARAKCISCHGVGGAVGPDLSKIGGKFDRIHLIESILEPSTQIVEGYRSSKILLVDGTVLTGIIKDQTDNDFAIEDSSAKRQSVRRSDVELIQASETSIMPSGLASDLTETEFTDLIAYLESLRTGMAKGFGAETKGPLRVAEGFKIETVTTGLTGVVGMEVLDDGRVLICEQTGTLRVVKNGKLLPQPMLSLEVEHYWERGLIGVTKHPRFKPFTHHVISRWKVNGDLADPNSEQIFLEGATNRNWVDSNHPATKAVACTLARTIGFTSAWVNRRPNCQLRN